MLQQNNTKTMNTNYAITNEENDFNLLLQFNQKLKLKELGRTPQKYPTDASGYTQDNKYVELELKRRFINIDTYQTIIIEPYKLQYAKDNENIIILYVNFTNDEHAIVFNLHKVNNLTKREYNIPSKLYERIKQSNRYELPLKDAYVYKKQNGEFFLTSKP